VSKTLLLVLIGFGLALVGGLGIAQADGEVSFGIRPTKAFEDRPETFSYFFHELTPGAVLTDEALVMNDGDVPVTLKLYAADGITAQNGGTAFTKQGQESTGASAGNSQWLSVPVTNIALAPGQEMITPFTINVPPDASPGHHVAGLIVEGPPSEGGEGQLAVNVIRRVGVAVVIDVPGPHVAGLEITGTCLRQQDEQGATFEVAVRNTGNIFVKGEGSLLLANRNGEELTSIPLSMDTVLPGDATTFQVTHPDRLADGDHVASATLNYEGKTAVLEGVEMKVKGGQPKDGCDPPEERALPPADTTEIVPAPTEEGGPGIGRYAAYGAPLLALALVAAVVIVWRRARKRPTDITEIEPPPAEEGGPSRGRYAAYAAPSLAVALAALALIALRRVRKRRVQQ
jgi:hypothetical protein